MSKKPTLLIDGDILIYEACFAVETPIHWGNDWWTLHADAAEAKQKIDAEVVELVETLDAGGYKVCLSDSHNFRKDIDSSYKSNRTTRKPICYAEVKAYIREAWEAVVWKNLEADDCMGILATEDPDNTIIVSIDKDMRQIPGRVYNWRNPDHGIVTISQQEADRFHLMQTLTGDAVDGYAGCPGIGPKRAEAIVDGGWPAVVEAYEKAGLGESHAVTQARLARILRAGEYAKKSGRVKHLWTPEVKNVTA